MATRSRLLVSTQEANRKSSISAWETESVSGPESPRQRLKSYIVAREKPTPNIIPMTHLRPKSVPKGSCKPVLAVPPARIEIMGRKKRGVSGEQARNLTEQESTQYMITLSLHLHLFEDSYLQENSRTFQSHCLKKTSRRNSKLFSRAKEVSTIPPSKRSFLCGVSPSETFQPLRRGSLMFQTHREAKRSLYLLHNLDQTIHPQEQPTRYTKRSWRDRIRIVQYM